MSKNEVNENLRRKIGATTDVCQPWTDLYNYYFEYLIIRSDYSIIPFDYLIIK